MKEIRPENLLGYRNHGGLLGKGVCWWHSRFTRNALYLADPVPEEPPPCAAEVRRIVSRIMRARGMTAVPGYSCLRDFSIAHKDEIQRMLEWRQIFEGVILFAWINGLAGTARTDPCSLRSIMDRLFWLSCEGVVYAKFQTPGLDAHSILVTGMTRLPRSGYEVSYLDSNSIGEQVLEYHAGYSFLTLSTGMTGVPYPQRRRELLRLRSLAARGS